MPSVTGMTADHILELLGEKADLDTLGKLLSAQLPDGIMFNGEAVTLVKGLDFSGTANNAPAIQTALNTAPRGSTVLLPPGIITVNEPIYIPPEKTLRGQHGGHIDDPTGSYIKPLATFSGAAVIILVDQTTGGYSVVSNEQRIEYLTIDGVNLPGTTIDGIQAQGYVHGVYIRDVHLRRLPNHGIGVVTNASGGAYSWRVIRAHASACKGNAFTATMTDTLWFDCEAIGTTGHGFYAGGANSVFVACRAEWSGLDGYNLGASTGVGQGSGGPTFVACTTDRNSQNGVSIPNTAVGNAPVSFVGCTFRRDGRGSAALGYSAINVNSSTQPVVITGCTVYPGTGDDGTGIASPQYGISVTGSTRVQVNGGSFHAISEAIHDGGSGARILRSPNVIERVGPTNAPVDIVRGVQTYGSTGGSLDVPDHLAGMAQPREHNLVAWSVDPAYVSSGKVGVAGTLYLSAIYVHRPTTISKLCWGINTTASGVTAGQNFIGLYDQQGNLLRSLGVDARLTTTGAWQETITDLAVTPGVYWFAYLFNCTTTMPAVYRAGDLSASLLNIGVSGSFARFATNGTGRTSLPATITTSSNAIAQFSYFGALA